MKKGTTEKKNLRRLLTAAVASALCAAALLSQGCKSPIQRAAEEKEARRTAKVIDYSQCYSEEGGYHFPGYNWGDSFGDFQKAADYPISEISGYSADNGIIYDAKDWRIQFGDQVSDSASVATDEDARLRMIIFGLEGNDISDEYFEAYKKVLSEAFSTEPEKEERDENTEAGTFHYVTYYFRKALSDGKLTSIQWAKATRTGFTQPSLITFSFACAFPEEEESSSAAK